jgi:hypothetical protein
VRVIEETRLEAYRDDLIAILGKGVAEERERFRFLHAVATLGGPDAVRCLRRHLGPRRIPWPMSQTAAEARRTAILGLRDVEDESVRRYLIEGARSRDRLFASACAAALSLAGKRGGKW